MQRALLIHPGDNTAVALTDLAAGEAVDIGGAAHATANTRTMEAIPSEASPSEAIPSEVILSEAIPSQDIPSEVILSEAIPSGHKFALRDIARGEPVLKYGHPIGTASADIARGAWVHTHNVRTNLSGELVYRYDKEPARALDAPARNTFEGYLREDGQVGVRNEIWVLPIVGCVNEIARQVAARANERYAGILDGVFTATHPWGCSQMTDDQQRYRMMMAALAQNPNAGGVLLLGLGCENSHIDTILPLIPESRRRYVEAFAAQSVEDEFDEAMRRIDALAARVSKVKRTTQPVSKLVVGLKCGGSDGFSGITANPIVGRFSDILVAAGGSSVLTEVPEMFGAETLLMRRARDRAVFDDIVSLINGFKRYFEAHGQVVYENPSPGNKAGGLTTLEDKSLGCTQKGGQAEVSGVIRYGERIQTAGLQLLEAPGNDLVASTATAAAGCQLLLFTTGRGTPYGTMIPTLKIATNGAVYARKRNWFDFDGACVLEGESFSHAARRLYDAVLDAASGARAANERMGFRDISFFKDGVIV